MRNMSARRAPEPEERQRDAERTRRRILRAALTEFSRQGYQGARVAAIAREAGVNSQLISYYFGGKRGLFDAVQQAWDRTEQEMGAREHTYPEVIGGYVPTTEDRRDYSRLLALRALQGDSDRELEGMRQALADLRRRQDQGEIDPALDADCLLLALVAAASAPAVYASLAEALDDTGGSADDRAERYAAVLAEVVSRLSPRGGDTESATGCPGPA
jgi:AcrR family transcriptional regulator